MLDLKPANKIKYLIQATKLLCDSGVCPRSQRVFHFWWETVKFSHKKGYLYLGFDNLTHDVDFVAIGFRVKKVFTDTGKVIPNNEEGDILYVPILASKSKDRYKTLKMLSFYKSMNDVRSIAYRWRGDKDDLRIRRFNNV